MKKKKYMIVVALIFFLPINVMAATGSLSASCTPQRVSRGGEISCTLSANTDFDVTKIEIPYSLGDGLTATAFVPADSDKFTNTSISGNKISATVGSELTGSFMIGTFKISVSDTAKSEVKNIVFSNVLFNDSISITSPSSLSLIVPATLRSLTVTDNSLTLTGPSNNIYGLILESNVSNFGFTAVSTMSDDAVVFKNGDTVLNPASIDFSDPSGQNSMQIDVIVGSGDAATTYSVIVSRETTQSTTSGNPYLSSLTLSGQTVNLRNQSTADEEISVTLNTTASYQLRAVLSDSDNYEFVTGNNLPGSCSVASGVLTCDLSGEVSMAIMVAPKISGSSKNYILHIMQGSGSSGSSGSDEGSTSTGSGSGTGIVNPQTGGAAYVMAIILVLSLIVSLYLYKRTINNFQ